MDGARDVIGQFLVKLGQTYNLNEEETVRVQSRSINAAGVALDKTRESSDSLEERPIISEIGKKAEEEAEEILSSEDPLGSLKTECLDKIVVGEDQNKQLLFLLLLSGKYAKVDPKANQIIIIMGEPGAGKSNLANLSRVFNSKEVGRFSEHALDYSDLSSCEVLYIKEMGYADEERQGISTIKFLSIEDGGYVVEYTIRDNESGHFTTEQKKVPPITMVTTTTRIMVDSQLDRRAWTINPDESKEQTEKILKFKADKEDQTAEVQLDLRKITEYDFALMVLKKVVDEIESYPVIIPYTHSITSILNLSRLRARGDYDKLITLVKLCSLLYQKQLPTIRLGDKKVIIATPRMFSKAMEIALEPLKTMTLEMDSRVRTMLKILLNKKIEGEGAEIHKKERIEIAKELKTSEKTILRYLYLMEQRGYVIRYNEEGKTKAVFHKLQYSLSDIFTMASSLGDGTSVGTPQSPMSHAQNLLNETILTINKIMGQTKFVDKGVIKQIADILNKEQTDGGQVTINVDGNLAYSPQAVCPIISDDMKQDRGTQDNTVSQPMSHLYPTPESTPTALPIKEDEASENNDQEQQKATSTDVEVVPIASVRNSSRIPETPDKNKHCSDCAKYQDNVCLKHPDLLIVPTSIEALTCFYYSPKHVGGGS